MDDNDKKAHDIDGNAEREREWGERTKEKMKFAKNRE